MFLSLFLWEAQRELVGTRNGMESSHGHGGGSGEVPLSSSAPLHSSCCLAKGLLLEEMALMHRAEKSGCLMGQVVTRDSGIKSSGVWKEQRAR